jgi:hypothetical protein
VQGVRGRMEVFRGLLVNGDFATVTNSFTPPRRRTK